MNNPSKLAPPKQNPPASNFGVKRGLDYSWFDTGKARATQETDKGRIHFRPEQPMFKPPNRKLLQ